MSDMKAFNPDLGPQVLVPEMLQQLDLEHFLQRYGHGSRRRVMEPLYRQMLAEAVGLLQPLSLHRTLPAAAVPQYGDFLGGAELVTIGICSVGSGIDRRVIALSESRMVEAVVLDEIGTAMVLELANRMFRCIRSEARARGMRTTPSYRPGIGRWPLELQHDIYEALDAEAHGLKLHESLQILPQKTVSMLVGAGADLQVRRIPVQWYRQQQAPRLSALDAAARSAQR